MALHGTSSGNAPLEQMLFAWGMMLVSGVVYFTISRCLFKKMLYKARVDATLRME